MRFLLCLLLTSCFLLSCDDGDVIATDTSFQFNSKDLALCNTGIPTNSSSGDAVFFNINSDTNEAISVQLSNRFYNDTIATVENGEVKNIDMNSTQVVYRKFENDVNSNYFCSGIPNTELNIISELKADRGTITIITREDIDPNGDDDNDGVKNIDEGYLADGTTEQDTDQDGFLDFRDIDDDNDNILTKDELGVSETNNTPRDSDGDSTPDYLDNDDDDDGVLTRNEITENIKSPLSATNPDKVPLYLDPNSKDNSFTADFFLENTFSTVMKTSVSANNLGLTDGVSSVIREVLPLGSFTKTRNTTQKVKFEEEAPTEETAL